MSVDCNLRLSDVHATADTVGREFKKLTDRFGMECAMGLLPPIVRGLEWLEAYVESYQHLQTRLSELQMENDTVTYEKEQRIFLAEENKRLSEMIRELQRQNKCLLMELDELHFKITDISEQTNNHQLRKHTEIESEILEKLEPTPDLSPIPLPHVPDRVVHISQNYPSHPSYHSPTLTPSPPPPSTAVQSTSHNNSTNIQSPPNQISKDKLPSSPPRALHTSPLLPSHHHLYSSRMVQTPTVTRAHRLLQPVGRSSSLSDVVGIKVQPLIYPSDRQEDMYEKSRATRRLSQVEGDLEITSRQLQELQRSREKVIEENKQLKTQLQQLKAEAALQNICTSKQMGKKATKEAPRYYKEDVMRVLTEKNQLKEKLHTLQEELAEAKDALKNAHRTTTLNKVTTTNRVATAVSEEQAVVVINVRSILTESIDLNTYASLTTQTNVQLHAPPVIQTE